MCIALQLSKADVLESAIGHDPQHQSMHSTASACIQKLPCKQCCGTAGRGALQLWRYSRLQQTPAASSTRHMCCLGVRWCTMAVAVTRPWLCWGVVACLAHPSTTPLSNTCASLTPALRSECSAEACLPPPTTLSPYREKAFCTCMLHLLGALALTAALPPSPPPPFAHILLLHCFFTSRSSSGACTERALLARELMP